MEEYTVRDGFEKNFNGEDTGENVIKVPETDKRERLRRSSELT